ncbi:GntR family transcriptional regulator [Microbacterium aurantiacum]|uniref:GntR family transcriptional regulator n=1 Tax=Microbacterium aurantiacum TaxID=162393 RepID=UPI004036748C
MITVNPGGAVPPYEQIRSQIADLIGSGQLAADQRLPPVRQLAADLGVASGTVAKAYSLLESEGHITASKSRGTHVASGRRHPENVQTAANQYVKAVAGTDLEQAISAVRSAWNLQYASA